MAGTDPFVLLSSSFGYGFVADVESLITKNRAGKAVLVLPAGSHILPTVRVAEPDEDWVACASTAGHLLIFPVAELPTLGRGKGQKILQIPSAKLKSGSEAMKAITVLGPDDELRIYSGNRHITLKEADQEHYIGDRARRGMKLPRGFQRVDRMEPAGT
jgi:topoisomerase-4 subunit A